MKEITSVYLHISNGGVTFSVIDEGQGPIIQISSAHFGNNTIVQKVHVTSEELRALENIFRYAADYEGYSKPYCVPAKVAQQKPFDIKSKKKTVKKTVKNSDWSLTAYPEEEFNCRPDGYKQYKQTDADEEK